VSAGRVAAAQQTMPRRATVIVLGDLARSPRMRRHAECLAAAGVAVDVVGYVDTPLADVAPWRETIRVRALAPPAGAATGGGRRAGGMRLPRAVGRLARDMLGIGAALWRSPPDWVIVQNPPAVHVLPLLSVLCRWRRCRLVVDWHNFGWTMLALRRGRRSRVVALAGWLERSAARRADVHLCVSEAMRRRLAELCGIDAVVFRDLPARAFVEAAGGDREDLRRALLPALDLPPACAAELLDGRAALLVSATSWSADEDFAVLLEALNRWESDGGAAARPHLVVVVSGRGPRRAEYERELRARRTAAVTVRTAWLAEEDYPRLLAAADLGLCFHRSSSGVDLPMKLADMLGACLPACVLDYGPCLAEIVRDGENAFLFATASDLAALWRRLLIAPRSELAAMSGRLRAGATPTWQQHWRRRVAPLLRGAAPEDIG
jgi:beta-1,4-mannosyltransferase